MEFRMTPPSEPTFEEAAARAAADKEVRVVWTPSAGGGMFVVLKPVGNLRPASMNRELASSIGEPDFTRAKRSAVMALLGAARAVWEAEDPTTLAEVLKP
jgi:hypothetical protein